MAGTEIVYPALAFSFDGKARELASTSKDPEAIAAELKKVLPKRSMADWMIGFNVKSRYSRK